MGHFEIVEGRTMRGKMRPWAPAPILMTTGTWWLLGTYVDGCGWLEY
jgi:hypothetical protein